jgi:hypothetical protein
MQRSSYRHKGSVSRFNQSTVLLLPKKHFEICGCGKPEPLACFVTRKLRRFSRRAHWNSQLSNSDDSISEDTQLLRGFAVCPVVRLEYICRRSPFRQGYYDRVICCCRAGHKVMNNWPLVANVCIICSFVVARSGLALSILMSLLSTVKQVDVRKPLAIYLLYSSIGFLFIQRMMREEINKQLARREHSQPPDAQIKSQHLIIVQTDLSTDRVHVPTVKDASHRISS